jgi:ribosomal-protein-alanine N-acetyltransferase
MRLAPASAAEAEVLAQAHAFGFDAPWSVADFAQLFDGVGAYGFLAWDGARPLGMIACRVVFEDAEVLTIAVDPAARGRGVGRALLEAAVGVARLSGATAMFLEVAVDNAPALALYGRAGFVRAGLRKDYYDRGAAGQADAAAMRLDLVAESS